MPMTVGRLPMHRCASRPAVIGAVTLLCAAGATLGAASAAAAAPALVGGCGDTVRGTPGESVGLRDLGVRVVTLGVVPESGSQTFEVAGLLGPLGPSVCTLTAEAVPAVTEPVDRVAAPVVDVVEGAVGPLPGPSSPAEQTQAQQQPAPVTKTAPVAAAPGPVPLFGPPSVPAPAPTSVLFDGALLSRAPNFGFLAPGMVPSSFVGLAPQFGILGARDGAAADVAAAGRAVPLAVRDVDRVALPVLAAAALLSIVTAVLVRSSATRPRRAR